MEFVDGGPVDAYCDEHRLTVDQRLDLFRTICAGVQYAHENFIVHRDIKPDNILIAPDGTPKLLDFGVAKLLTDDTPADGRGPAPTWWMTPDYASPEQLAARAAVTTASDVYSLGVLLHVLLTGVRPYDLAGGPPVAIQAQLAEARLMPPSRRVREDTDGARQRAARRDTTPRDLSARLSGDLDAIVARALSRDVATRYPTVDRLARDLERHRTRHPVEARRRDASYVARRFVRRHALALALTAGLLVLLAGGVAALWRQTGIAARERDLARAPVRGRAAAGAHVPVRRARRGRERPGHDEGAGVDGPDRDGLSPEARARRAGQRAPAARTGGGVPEGRRRAGPGARRREPWQLRGRRGQLSPGHRDGWRPCVRSRPARRSGQRDAVAADSRAGIRRAAPHARPGASPDGGRPAAAGRQGHGADAQRDLAAALHGARGAAGRHGRRSHAGVSWRNEAGRSARQPAVGESGPARGRIASLRAGRRLHARPGRGRAGRSAHAAQPRRHAAAHRRDA